MKFSIKKSFIGSTQIKSNTAASENLSLYEQIGGTHTISFIVDYVINLISISFYSDSRLNLFNAFNKDNISSFRTKLITFLIKASGGSEINIASQYENDASNHASEKLLNISNTDFEKLKVMCYAALYHFELKPDYINQFIASIDTHKNLFVSE